MKESKLDLLFLIILCISACSSRELRLGSPDGNLKVEIIPGGEKNDTSIVSVQLKSGDRVLMLPSTLHLEVKDSPVGKMVNIIRIETASRSDEWTNNFGERKNIPDNYNELKLYMMCDSFLINFICRAYNEGVAFAYEFPEHEGKDSILLTSENVHFRFTSDHLTWSAPRAQALYSHLPLSRIDAGCERPLVIEVDSTMILAVGEAKLIDYPRMKFYPDTTYDNSIKSKLDGIAMKSRPFRSPWRYLLAGKSAGDLLEKNYFLLNLNDPSEIKNTSWIRPGKVLREVTLTTEGGKAAVDFTSSHGMQYVEFDAGWYGPENNDASDAKAVNVDPARSRGPLDLQEVTRYADSKNIGILLYVNRRALERQIDSLLPLYRDWGIKGLKFGFVQVGNQDVTSWLHEAVKKAAGYQMVVDVHDEYRPTGFSRTYPNFLTQEGIRGDEESPPNSHTLVTMFTRMISGAGDNTICYYNDRVEKKMGSHASQLAKAVCIFSPLQFIYWYDRPANIGEEPEIDFFSNIPVVWDETKVLHAKIGEYGFLARRSGEEWFIGGINGEKEVTLPVNFSFLDEGKRYIARFYSDDPSVNTTTHVKIDSAEIDKSFIFRAKLNINNGMAIHVKPLR